MKYDSGDKYPVQTGNDLTKEPGLLLTKSAL